MWVARQVQAGVQIPKTSGLVLQSTWRARAAGPKGGINILEPGEQLGARDEGFAPPTAGQFQGAPVSDESKPLQGIFFSQPAGAGPCGLCADHVAEILSTWGRHLQTSSPTPQNCRPGRTDWFPLRNGAPSEKPLQSPHPAMGAIVYDPRQHGLSATNQLRLTRLWCMTKRTGCSSQDSCGGLGACARAAYAPRLSRF